MWCNERSCCWQLMGGEFGDQRGGWSVTSDLLGVARWRKTGERDSAKWPKSGTANHRMRFPAQVSHGCNFSAVHVKTISSDQS